MKKIIMTKSIMLASVLSASLTVSALAQPQAPSNLRRAREYFVSPNGSTANSGTADSPWPLSYALSHVAASSIITLLPGTYPSFEIATSALTLRSQIKWAAKVLGSRGAHGIVTATGVSNVVVDGLEVAYSYHDGIKFNGHNSTARNCWVHHAAYGDPNAVPNTDSSFTGQGIAAHNQYGTLIENNLVEYCGMWISHDHGIYINGTNCVVRNNVIRNNLTWGIQLYDDYPGECVNIHVYNNLVYNNKAGLTVWSHAGYTNFVYNNTILARTNYCIISDYGHLIAKNNILAVTESWHPIISSEDGSVVEADYNLANKSYSGGAHDLITNYFGLVNTNRGLYWLKSDSPARGIALAGAAESVNFFSQSQSSVSDIGAFQYSTLLAEDTRTLDPSGANSDYWSPP